MSSKCCSGTHPRFAEVWRLLVNAKGPDGPFMTSLWGVMDSVLLHGGTNWLRRKSMTVSAKMWDCIVLVAIGMIPACTGFLVARAAISRATYSTRNTKWLPLAISVLVGSAFLEFGCVSAILLRWSELDTNILMYVVFVLGFVALASLFTIMMFYLDMQLNKHRQ